MKKKIIVAVTEIERLLLTIIVITEAEGLLEETAFLDRKRKIQKSVLYGSAHTVTEGIVSLKSRVET